MRSRMRSILSALTILVLVLGVTPGIAWSGGHEAGEEGVVEELEDNVEHSEELLKKTYEEDRAEGQGRVEAAGNAYEAVLEAGREKPDEDK